MAYPFRIVILCGGLSSEREVSLQSGEAIFRALSHYFPTERFILDDNALPPGLVPERDIIFPIIHGKFGEDGALQAILERRGFSYAGSGIIASDRCMHKLQAKEKLRACSLLLPQCISFQAPNFPRYEEICDSFHGKAFVVKPENEGSSIAVHKVFTKGDWQCFCSGAEEHLWLLEEFVEGKEITVAWLNDRPLPCVEIRPKGGFYDYDHKYMAGMTDYLCPAPLEESVMRRILADAEKACLYCGCRDFARVDFILMSDQLPYFLEINTIPGMTETSLLPKSALAIGLTFEQLCYEMIYPAIRRFGFRELPPHAMV
ncbi:MAG: D-alanine--D-alanine ligase [Puniceicoccales bacterium]|nr:D-alanine--D-alanine ligase [Puniceicoccales bacterium]